MGHREVARIKGGKGGLSLVIDHEAEVSAVIDVLRHHVSSSPAFFRGAALRLQTDGRMLSEPELGLLSDAVKECGMVLEEGVCEAAAQGEHKVLPANSPVSEQKEWRDMYDRPEERALLIKRTVRSGQSITFEGNVVIRGDVNPGADVICTGDIIVLGALRGVAHAGAAGDRNAVVMAFWLEPTQLRIADVISRAPDEKGPRPAGPELARVRDDMIQIESYQP